MSPEHPHRRARSTLLMLTLTALLAATVLGLRVSAANATSGYGFQRAIGSEGSAAGQLRLGSASAVALSTATDGVYVADTGNHRVEEFNQAGEFVLMFGREVNATKVEGGVATEAEEDLCSEEEVVLLGVRCQAGVPGSAPGQFESPVSVAVDNAPGGEGDVYVDDTGNQTIQKFTAQGELLGSWGVGGQLSEVPGPTVTADLTAGSDVITATSGQFLGGDFAPMAELIGEGIPPGTHITGCSGNETCEMSNPATETRTDVSVTTPPNSLSFVQKPAGYEGSAIGLAVDPASGRLILSANGLVVFVFERDGTYVQQWFPKVLGQGLFGGGAIALDGAGHVYLSGTATANSLPAVREFTQDGALLAGGAPGSTSGLAAASVSEDLAAGSTEVLFVDRGSLIEGFGASGEPLGAFGAPVLSGGGALAVHPTDGTVFAATAGDQLDVFAIVVEGATGAAGEVRASTARLTGEVDPRGAPVKECFFEYATTAAYGQRAACEQPDAAELGSGSAPVAVHAALTGLTGGTGYHYRLVVVHEDALSGEPVTVHGADRELHTLPVPLVSASEALDVTEASARLQALVNPEGLAVSSCVFEYGTSLAYGQTASCEQSRAQIGSGAVPVPVAVTLTGLAANTTYHWRLVVADANGTSLLAPGGTADHTFIYPLAGPAAACPDEQARAQRASGALPDCRAYEMVTPAQKNAAMVSELALDNVPPQIGRDGRRVVAASTQCFGRPESCTAVRFAEGEPYAFERTDGGWVTRPLAPPASAYEVNSWEAINADGGALFLAPSAPESLTDQWLARGEGGSLLNLGPLGEHDAGSFPPDFTALDPQLGGVLASAGMSNVLYQTVAPVWSFDEGGVHAKSLYEYPGAASAPLLVGVSGGYESHQLVSACGTAYGNPHPGVRKQFGALSEDGRVVFFTAKGHDEVRECAGVAPAVDELYARVDNELAGRARTVPLSVEPPAGACAHEPCQHNAANELRDAEFEGASADGSSVFFTDTQQLTDSASQSGGSAVTGVGCSLIAGAGGCNLYESSCPRCQELSPGEEASVRRLVDVSETNEHGPAAGGPRVQGMVAISEDGSHVYFVAQGVLTGGEENENHERAEDGADNLYVYAEGRRTFVARLSAKKPGAFPGILRDDEGEWEQEFPRANVTPDGRFLLFTSTRALTPDDTRPEGPAQVYEYDAGSGHLVRVSKGQGGFNDNGNAGVGSASIAPVIDTAAAESVPVRTDPSMSDDGRYVFFQSPIALTAGALNDVSHARGEESLDEGLAQNVYEYHEGQVSLISDGKDTAGTPGGDSEGQIMPVQLLGSDASGANVFFATFDPLVPEDTDTQRDFYDARVCSEAEPCSAPVSPEPPPSCGQGACQAPPAPSAAFGAPASELFSGAGNIPPVPAARQKAKSRPLTRAQKLARALRACRRKRVRKRRAACERAARRAYGARKASRSRRKHSGGRTAAKAPSVRRGR